MDKIQINTFTSFKCFKNLGNFFENITTKCFPYMPLMRTSKKNVHFIIYQAKWTDLANISDWDNITNFPTLFIFLSKHPLSIQKQLLLNRNLKSMWRLLKLVFDIQKLTLQINAVFTMHTLCSYFILYHFNNSYSFTLCMVFFQIHVS